MIIGNGNFIAINRAVNDLKMGLPVIIHDDDSKKEFIILSVDATSSEIFNELKNHSKDIFLLLTKERSNFLWKKHFKQNQKLNCTNLSFNTLLKLAFSIDDFVVANDSENSDVKYDYGLWLAKLAELIPSLIIVDDFSLKKRERILSINTSQIKGYLDDCDFGIKEVCSTALKLKNTDALIKSFRALHSAKEHYAIIIQGRNTVNKSEFDAPLVRIHSSCFTGDLLNSIACDCHDQLHMAIEKMSNESGGVIIYLNQEGRGIGLTNKLRTYNAQKQGYDTVEANKILGFDDDHRTFPIAASILFDLGITKINLLTNNPRKAKSLEEQGIIIQDCVSHLVEVAEEARGYIKTKAEKLDHKISV